jgi:hypothetical protein
MNSDPTTDAPGVDSHDLFSAAGVQPGDSAEWSMRGWPLVVGTIKTTVTVKGIHVKNGVHAIEVIDATGHGFRAYPGELRKVENANNPSAP